jgi:hypothetical protein
MAGQDTTGYSKRMKAAYENQRKEFERQRFESAYENQTEEFKRQEIEDIRKNKPNILDIAPAVQDKTRVGGLMEDIEVPAGEFADMDLMEEKLIEFGFPPGLISDFIDTYKKDPAIRQKFDESLKHTDTVFKEDPQLKKDLFKGTDLENIDEDLPDEPFGPGGWGAGGL